MIDVKCAGDTGHPTIEDASSTIRTVASLARRTTFEKTAIAARFRSGRRVLRSCALFRKSAFSSWQESWCTNCVLPCRARRRSVLRRGLPRKPRLHFTRASPIIALPGNQTEIEKRPAHDAAPVTSPARIDERSAAYRQRRSYRHWRSWRRHAPRDAVPISRPDHRGAAALTR